MLEPHATLTRTTCVFKRIKGRPWFAVLLELETVLEIEPDVCMHRLFAEMHYIAVLSCALIMVHAVPDARGMCEPASNQLFLYVEKCDIKLLPYMDIQTCAH